MISRRSFLKFSGLAVAAVGAGYGTGSLLNSGSKRSFAIHGFLPDNPHILAGVIQAFIDELPDNVRGLEPVIEGESGFRNKISEAYRAAAQNHSRSFLNKGRVILRMTKLGSSVAGDILVTDDRKKVYTPERDFSRTFAGLRASLQSMNASYLFSAEFFEVDIVGSLLRKGENNVVIENTKGIVDRIPLDGKKRIFSIEGPHGRTGVTVIEGRVHVHASSCRHKLCQQTGFASRAGEIIACAPNHVLIRIVSA